MDAVAAVADAGASGKDASAAVAALRVCSDICGSGELANGEASRGGLLAAVLRLPASMAMGTGHTVELASAWVGCIAGVLRGIRDVNEDTVVGALATVLAVAGVELGAIEGTDSKKGKGEAMADDDDDDDDDEDEDDEDEDEGAEMPLRSGAMRLFSHGKTGGPLELYCRHSCEAVGMSSS